MPGRYFFVHGDGSSARRMRSDAYSGLAGALVVVLAGAAVSAADDRPPPRPFDHLAPAAAARFAAGLRQFETRETPATGLGPVFNAASCAVCHAEPTTGGSSATFVTRFGRVGRQGFDPLTNEGGPVIQTEGIVTDSCAVAGETVPPDATIVARRETPPLFGLGLVDAIPDAAILRLAAANARRHDGISGRPNLVRGRVGRFGWKAQVATLLEFTAVAYQNEIGITSPTFPDEVAPQGGPPVCDLVPDPEDDGTRIDSVTAFLLLLAPPARGARTKGLRAGRIAFHRALCARCHVASLRTGQGHPIRALRGIRVPVFSDLLLHDMGPLLADGLSQGDATGTEFRTAPLWGVGGSAPYLHDGRAATLEDAIAAHGGEAAGSRDRFFALPDEARRALITFLGFI